MMLKTMPNFAFLTPPSPVKKLGEGWARYLYQCRSLTYDRTAGIHLMAIHCAGAERGVLIKKKRKEGKKERKKVHR